MDLQTLKDGLVSLGVPVYVGYAPSHAKLPYVVLRPLLVDPTDVAINGDAIDCDNQATAYAAGASVEASFNLARGVMSVLQGARIGGYVLGTSMGYSGALVEGHYESQVTIQNNQGGI